MVDFILIPGIIVTLGAFILPLIPQKFRSGAFIAFPLLALFILWTSPEGSLVQTPFADFELHLFTVDALSRIFGTIFALIAIIGGIYSYHIKDLGQQTSALAYAGGALGVTFAGDFFTLIVFWEIMAVSSAYLIWARGKKSSDKAGMRYLIVHALGGGLLLSGILLHLSSGGSLLLESFTEHFTLSNTFILVGIAINAAIPPLHAWLPDAYPKATVTGAVFMSAFTTKSAVYVLIRLFPGWEILMWFGAFMAIYGVIYAVICKDIREILAYHIVSQVGFMVCGIGIGTEMALNGATAHAYSHILYKALLFMSTGAVLYATGTSQLTYLGGLVKKMPYTLGLYLVGGFAISGVPFFNGFISKSMTVSAAGYAHEEMAMLLLLFASVGTFLSVGIKLPYYAWFHKEDTDLEIKKLPANMYIGMGLAAFACIFYGLFPNTLYMYLPYEVDYNPFTAYHFVEMIQILVLTFIGFWIFKHKLVPSTKPKIALDFDWFYRKPAHTVRIAFVNLPNRFFAYTEKLALLISKKLSHISKNPLEYLSLNQSNPDHPIKTDDFVAPIHAAMALILFSFVVVTLFVLL